MISPLKGKPCAVVAVYQFPGSNEQQDGRPRVRRDPPPRTGDTAEQSPFFNLASDQRIRESWL